MITLGIETSCDETSCALAAGRKITALKTYTQVALHSKYGGIVPEYASREHIKKILPVFEETLKEARLKLDDIDRIAVCYEPGLIGSLLAGRTFSRTLSVLTKKKLIKVNHLHAHLFSAFLDNDEKVDYPYMFFLASGGHTMTGTLKSKTKFEILGETVDDAVGEAYDKTAKILGFGYPGGKIIDDFAKKGDLKYKFTPARVKKHPLHFSFSGLKTAVLYTVKDKNKFNIKKKQDIYDLCASFQHTVVRTVEEKILLLHKKTGINKMIVGGGVLANSAIRAKLQNLEKEKGIKMLIPPLKYCMDNGAMIAGYANIK